MFKKREKMNHQYEPFKHKRIYNSRYAEYMYAAWRQHRNKLFVTIDTIVPEKPKKMIEEPDDAKFHLKADQLNEQIEKLNEDFKERKADVHSKRSEMTDG